ncbi:asparaginase [Flavobacteriales bacterium]|nr:asparaginase [Flavobacteriales bacterium]
MMSESKILIIYTGGTIGMIRDEVSGTLKPFHLKSVIKKIPSILKLGIELHAMELDEIIDSSNVTTETWIELAEIIKDYYDDFDGFVVLHGSDTMAYSASALSFLLENLAKPVIFTGSQLPIGLPRTDARENLITALQIAALRNSLGQPMINEVCIYFEDKLYRGNRTHKFNSENFDAFLSLNYPILAEAGVRINVYEHRLLTQSKEELRVHTAMNTNVAVLKLFPGLNPAPLFNAYKTAGIKAVILESYGSGNGPTDNNFLHGIDELIRAKVLVTNITQCREGRVEMGKYETSDALLNMGVLSGKDLTAEAAITKAMFVLGMDISYEESVELMTTSLRGEMTT